MPPASVGGQFSKARRAPLYLSLFIYILHLHYFDTPLKNDSNSLSDIVELFTFEVIVAAVLPLFIKRAANSSSKEALEVLLDGAANGWLVVGGGS